MFVFGIDIPLPEILFIALLLLIVAVVLIIVHMRNMNKHMKFLEKTTLDIKKFEEQEMAQIRRFEIDVQKLEADEAAIFVGKILPTVAKLENYVGIELLKNRKPQEICGEITKKGISSDIATRVVNNMTYYLETFHKMPTRRKNLHHKIARQMRVTFPRKK